MAYRGDDLDLRTPQTWSQPPAEGSGASDQSLAGNGRRGLYRTGPILVDDTLLQCCNQAFDLAEVHRAGQVRVEHLLNAMTRIDAAVSALETRGIRVASLRRETAAIVAGELPAVSGNGSRPHRSDELADLLRAASNLASRRNGAASVDDVIQVLGDYRSEFPSAELLGRFGSRAAPRDYTEPLPPLTRSAAEPRYLGVGGARYGSDFPRSYRTDVSGTPTDALQNSRIDALEQMLRALSQDFSNERHIVAGLVRDLSRDTLAHQDDQGRRQTALIERIGTLENTMLETRGVPQNESLVAKLETIETALELRLQEMSQSWNVLSTRLQDLELLIRDRAGSGAGAQIDDIRQAIDLRPIANRLDVIEEAVLNNEPPATAELISRFAKLETDIGRALIPADGSASASFAPIGENLGSLLDRVETNHSSVAKMIAEFGDRLGAVERAITAEIETAAAKHQAYAHDLTEVHEALLKVNQNQHTLAGSMDQWRTESASDVATIINKLAVLDRDNAVPMQTLNALDAHMDTMNRLIIERYHRRNRFWYWLFGTDDWIGASWPSQKAAIDAERERIKNVEQAPQPAA